jgi:transketolase
LGWERYTGLDGLRIGLDRFGASAPAEDLFKRFGFSAEAIVPQIVAALNQGDQ